MNAQVLVDTEQTRISDFSLSTLVSGTDWDLSRSTNVYVDAVTNSAMLEPACVNPAWQTSTAGIYAKWSRSNFTLDSSANWYDNNADSGGPFYQYLSSTGNTTGTGVGGVSTAVLPANQPVVVEYFAQQSTANSGGCFECGWNSSNSGATGVSLRFYADGAVEVWKDNQILGSYSLNGKGVDYYKTQDGGSSVAAGGSPPSQYMLVMIIPCRGRELLVLSSQGGGFSHVFTDIPEGTASPIITAATNFWFNVPPPYQPNVRVSLLQFQPSGTLIGTKSFFRYELPAGSALSYEVYGSVPAGATATASAVDGLNPAVPYTNNTNGVRLSIALATGTYGFSPLLYGARGYTAPVTGTTFPADVDVTNYVREMVYTQTDKIGSEHVKMVITSPQAIAALGAPAIDTQVGRPVEVYSDGMKILTGVGSAPRKLILTSFTPSDQDLNTDVSLEANCLWELAENFVFGDTVPLDGMSLGAAYTYVANECGLSANVSSAFFSFILGNAGAQAGNDWNCAIQAGSKGSTWLDRLHKTYAATAFHGIDENGVLQLLQEPDMPSVPAVTFYDSIAAAKVAGFDQTFVFESYDEQSIAPEANDVGVTGRDFRTSKPIYVHKRDAASANPTTAPSLRPDNWLGGIRAYGWVDPTITTQSLATTVCETLFNRLTPRRALGEFVADFKPQLRRGAMVKLVFSDGTEKIGRVKTVSARFQQISAQMRPWRPTTYIIQIGTDAAPLNTAGWTIGAIAQEVKTRTGKIYTVIGDGDLAAKIARRPITLQTSL